MAILASEVQNINWKMIIGFIIIILIIIIGFYYLFFAPVPGIEVIAPVSVRSAAEISKVRFNPEDVLNSEEFRALRRYTGQPSIGQVGRENPFIKF